MSEVECRLAPGGGRVGATAFTGDSCQMVKPEDHNYLGARSFMDSSLEVSR